MNLETLFKGLPHESKYLSLKNIINLVAGVEGGIKQFYFAEILICEQNTDLYTVSIVLDTGSVLGKGEKKSRGKSKDNYHKLIFQNLGGVTHISLDQSLMGGYCQIIHYHIKFVSWCSLSPTILPLLS